MSKQKKYLDRLKDLFQETNPVRQEPLDDQLHQAEETASRWLDAPDKHFHNDDLSPLIQNESPDLDDGQSVTQFLPPISNPASDGIQGLKRETNGSVITSPLLFGGESIGLIELEADPNKSWSAQETNLVASVAQEMALHLENLRLLEQSERYRQEAEQVVRRMTREAWESYLEGQTATINGYCFENNRLVNLDDASRNFSTATLDNPSSSEELIIHPVKVRDETIGQLVIEKNGHEVSPDLVAAVSERLGSHIEGLRLLEDAERARHQLDRRATELETVAKVSTAAATILDPSTLLQAVVDLTKYSFKLYHAQVYLLDEDQEKLMLAASSGKTGQAANLNKHSLSLQHDHMTVVKVAKERTGSIVSDARTQPGYQHYPHLLNTQSELGVPMVVGDRLIGVFSVLSDTPYRFVEDDMRTFTTLAAQVAVALRNAELYAEQMATVDRLRELDHLKSAFLANMSHELRTPLNSILGFTQVVLEGIDGPLTDYMISDLQLIEKNGKHLLYLINEVLDMAKIEAGRMSLSVEMVDLRYLLEEVIETISSQARDKSLYVNLESDPDDDLMIVADQLRLKQIILNLLGNSIKFTEKGGVTVYASRSGEFVEAEVRDTGVGIPPEKIETIFEAFSQVDNSTTRKVGGTGLGLPISRKLVEMHGGRLWAESKGVAGEGTIMHLVLPVHTLVLG